MPEDLARKYGEPLGLERGTASWITMDKIAHAQAMARLRKRQAQALIVRGIPAFPC